MPEATVVYVENVGPVAIWIWYWLLAIFPFISTVPDWASWCTANGWAVVSQPPLPIHAYASVPSSARKYVPETSKPGKTCWTLTSLIPIVPEYRANLSLIVWPR